MHREREIYRSDWMSVGLADVALPDGRRLDHHVVRLPTGAAAAVVVAQGRVLMLHRHRFVVDRWGWEVPAGRLDPASEDPVEGARREALEETGWHPRGGSLLVSGYPMPGLVDMLHHVVVFGGADHVGEPADLTEADRVEWVEVERARALIVAGEVPDGYSQWALLAWMTLDRRR